MTRGLTVAPLPVAIVFGVFIVAAVVVLVPRLFERLAGWPRLSTQFEAAPPSTLTPVGYGTLGVAATAPVKLQASTQGLVLSLLVRPFHSARPLLIPWRSVHEAAPGGHVLPATFTLGSHSGPKLFLKAHVARRLRSHLAANATWTPCTGSDSASLPDGEAPPSPPESC